MNEISSLLTQYQREHDVVAWQRLRSAIKALEGYWKGKHAGSITIPSCRQYAAYRMEKGISLSTIARELTCLRAACNHAKKWGRLDTIPTFDIPLDLPRREIWLFKDELRLLIETADDFMKNFIRLVYETASRRRAIETLAWSQINFARKTISLAKPGEKRTSKRRPVVPMGHLNGLLVQLHGQKVNEWVLGSNRCLSPEFEKTCRKAGILTVGERDGRPAGKVTAHVLRHSRATHLLEDGASLFAVASLMGDTVTTVQKVYGHVCLSSLESEISRSTL